MPNKEIQILYETLIKNWIKPTIGITTNLLNYLLEDQREDFEQELRAAAEIFSVHDLGKEKKDDEEKTPERVYHAFMIGLLSFIRGTTHRVKSNRESGYGFYDLMIIPNDKEQKGIIIEIKSINHENKSKVELEKALKQIEKKRYDQELKSQGVKDIVKLAVVFCGKKLWLRYGT